MNAQMAGGMRAYFDKSLRHLLLYDEERALCSQVGSSMQSGLSMQSTSPKELKRRNVSGGEHESIGAAWPAGFQVRFVIWFVNSSKPDIVSR